MFYASVMIDENQVRKEIPGIFRLKKNAIKELKIWQKRALAIGLNRSYEIKELLI